MTTTPTALIPDTDSDRLEEVLAAAAGGAAPGSGSSPAQRSGWIRATADALDAALDELVPLAATETSLPAPRLRGEVARSSGQLRMFADALESGALLEVIIDEADPHAQPVPRPDLRRMLVPVGPVLVFAASNFPFAFSVCGGDTAAALAAGCPVVVKAHPGHPRTSQRTFEVMAAALDTAGAPDGLLGLVHGVDAGVAALRDRRVRAGAFTGSVPGGLALHQVASSRPDPIPFFGELGSINPAFATRAAVHARGAEIADGFLASCTLGVGQFCTKPGLLFLPRGHGLEDRLRAAGAVAAARMLSPAMSRNFATGLERLRSRGDVDVLVDGATDAVDDASAETAPVAPSLLRTDVAALLADPEPFLEECFGPVSVIVEYDDENQLAAAAAAVPGSLTGTVHAEDSDAAAVQPLLAALTGRVGRVVWNGWPTGVAVSAAMQHGGPFPATVGAGFSSVGTTAARRFQRPVCYQDTPAELLPPALHDHNGWRIERRVNGRVTTSDVSSG